MQKCSALALAARAHQGQGRKGTDIPYIVHPCAVALILQRYGAEEELVVAGLLHDVVEDAGVPLSFLRAEFGAQVADLVEAVTERKRSDDGAERAWETRKTEALERLQNAGASAALLKAADTLHNVRSVRADAERVGPDVWKRFKTGRHSQLWLYRRTLEVMRAILGGHPILEEIEEEVGRLEHIAAE